MSFIDEDLSSGQTFAICLFLIPATLLNVYQLHKTLNIIRTLVGTRFFTARPEQGGHIPQGDEPVVTIQICVYNEATVVKKTIDAACQVDWPHDKLYVQVLDDSTDHTSAIIEEVSAKWRERGVNCQRLTRPTRVGYKAGNLAAHTKDVHGEFVALFDADHRCEPNYLRRAIPQFFKEDGTMDDKIGLVQTPWAYYNTHQNILTEYESLTLDYSHVIDQIGRASGLKCFGFNGTGGVWRNAAIEAAGGWKWDTVTEDLDISYLARLAGYEFIYLQDVPQQLEIPAGIRAHCKQKHRWTKGYMQVARKRLWKILRAPDVSLSLKIEAFFHMTMSLFYIYGLVIFVLGPIIASFEGFTMGLIAYVAVFPLITHIVGILLTIYVKVPSSNGHYKTLCSRTKRLAFVPVQLVFAMGMTIFETAAILDGLVSDDATFHRTPKEGSKRLATYLDEDDEEEDVQEDIDNDIEQGIDAVSTETKRCLPKMPLFLAHTLLGAIGVLLACYLIAWTPILLQSAIERNDSVMGQVFTMLPLLPALGLLYMHLSFLGTTFWSRYRTLQKKNAHKAAEGAVDEKKIAQSDHPSDTGSDEDYEDQS